MIRPFYQNISSTVKMGTDLSQYKALCWSTYSGKTIQDFKGNALQDYPNHVLSLA